MIVYVVTVDGRPDCAFSSQKLAAAFIDSLRKRQPSVKVEALQIRFFGEDDTNGSPAATSASRKMR